MRCAAGGAWQLLGAWLLLAVAGTAHACAPGDYAQELELAGLGVVYMGDFRYHSARDEAELSGGICFVSASEPQLTLRAPTMRVAGVQRDPTFTATGATLRVGGYTLFAERLTGDRGGLGLQNLSVLSPQFSGSAVRARYTLQGGRTILTGVSLKLGNFRVESAAAGLTQTTLVLQNARASTCACEGDGLYALAAPRATINLDTGVVRLEEGTLESLGLRFALDPNLRLALDGAPQTPAGGLQVGGAALLAAPVAPAPVGPTLDESGRVAVPVQLFPGAALELGVTGADDRPFAPVSLLNLRTGNLRAVVGFAGPGGRADALLRTPLAPGFGIDLSTTNRAWAEEGFLHEGALGLYGGRRLTGVLGEVNDTLVLGGQLFAALSQQTLAGTLVRSPRLGGRAHAAYTSAPTPQGTFALRTEGVATLYPSVLADAERTQLGLRVVPSWRRQVPGFRATLSLDQQFVWGRSPFSPRLDRLRPRSVLDGALTWGGGVGSPGTTVVLGARYAFVLPDARNPVRRARLEVAQTLPLGAVTLQNRLNAEVAGLLGPADPEVPAFVSAQLGFELSAAEFGFKGRYNLLPERTGLELLEVYGSAPFEFGSVTLRPFVALNAAPILAGAALPEFSGYGLELAVRSCCGTLVASYRLHDRAVRTAFDVRLAPEVPDP